MPVYTLLGGSWRNKVLVSIEVPRNTPEKIAEHSYEYYCQGIRGIKANNGYKKALQTDNNFLNGLNIFQGQVTCKPVAEDLGIEFIDPSTVVN